MPQTWEAETELCALATKYGTDKWNWHHYTPHYHRLLKDRRDRVKKVLEIGLGSADCMKDPTGRIDPYLPGASHRMWEEYFPNAEIFALDNNTGILINQGRIHSFFGDQQNEAQLRSVFPQLGSGFDLIVDDGSHRPDDQILSAKVFVPLLAPDGIYVIEDVWPYPCTVGWSAEPFGTKIDDIPFKCEVTGEGNNDDHLVIIRAGDL